MTKGRHTAADTCRRPRVARPSVGSFVVKAGVVVCTVALVVGGMAGFASAGGDAANAGLDTSSPTAARTAAFDQTAFAESAAATKGESFILETSAFRNVSGGVEEIAAEEEAARKAAEEAARIRDAECIAQAKKAQGAAAANGGVNCYQVDFSVGRQAFVEEWGKRINAYLEGSNLAGYGTVFAEAAFEYGVDPRWSPAISNTESGKGSHCFAWHNAWGWTNGSWSNWVSAIHDHVAGLAEVYGYTISYANAKQYCPPNYANWYRDTLNEMSRI